MIPIGPNADPKSSFFVDAMFDNSGYEHRNEHLHIQQCTYVEYDEAGNYLNSLQLIEDGCDKTISKLNGIRSSLIKFKGKSYLELFIWTSILDRTLDLINHDQFYLKPFQLDTKNANKFNIDCDLVACTDKSGICSPGTSSFGESCSSRYDVFNLASDDGKGRRRRDAEEVCFE